LSTDGSTYGTICKHPCYKIFIIDRICQNRRAKIIWNMLKVNLLNSSLIDRQLRCLHIAGALALSATTNQKRLSLTHDMTLFGPPCTLFIVRAGERTPRTPRPGGGGGGGGGSRLSGASCYVTCEFFSSVFNVFKIFVKIFVQNDIPVALLLI